MWLCTRYGFFSIVCGTFPDGRLDESTLMIRARSMRHLQLLRARHSLMTTPIRVSSDTDYPCRMIVQRAVGESVMRRLAAEIDYGNFKDEAQEQLPRDDRYHQFLATTWRNGLAMQMELPHDARRS